MATSPHCPVQARPSLSLRQDGFTVIELMIVVAVIAIILVLALPVYTNFSIRAKIGESMSVAAAAKTAVASTCQEDMTLTSLTNSRVGYDFLPSKWIQNITVSGDCGAPVITIQTWNTGAQPDPVLTLTGAFTDGAGSIEWTCASTAENYLLPSACRS